MENFFIMPDGQVIYVNEHSDRPDLDNRRDVLKYSYSINNWVNDSNITTYQKRKADKLAEKFDLPFVMEIW